MKIIKQFGIIFSICWLGTVVENLLPFAFFFIPAGVNVINYLDILKASWLPLVVICTVTTVITFAATAYSIRLTILLLHRKGGKKHD